MPTLVNRIESVIKEKGVTFNRVERDCGLGNGTIKRWEEQSPRLDKLVLVSEYLNVSLDYLVYGTLQTESSPNRDERRNIDGARAESGLSCDGHLLSDLELDLVAMFRLLPISHKEELFDLTYSKYKRLVEGERGSIFSTYPEGNEQQKSDPDEELEARHGTA